MGQTLIDNTLFIGNGFSRALFSGMPSWSNLFDGVNESIRDYTLLYEMHRLNEENRTLGEDMVKRVLIQKIKGSFSGKNINHDILELSDFGISLKQHQIHNIITTNYDDGIEYILCSVCGYKEVCAEEIVPEQIYSIRTYRLYHDEVTGHTVKLWKIHGDMERIKSITLGFDQYCGSLSKLMAYIKGSYRSSKNCEKTECKVSMKEKCATQKFDDLSWAELFFRTNVYIVGFGMDFSEIDIWWLLNKRARFKLEIPEINNTITYLYNEEFETPETKREIFAALRAFDVAYRPICSDSQYLVRIFSAISD